VFLPRSLSRLIPLLILEAGVARAQLYQGVVRDSALRTPVAGVVVSAIDSGGKSVGRTLSRQDGQYRLVVPPATARLRLQRIGYRMREVPYTASMEEMVSLDFSLIALPSLLDPVRVFGAAKCPKRRDNADAQALYEQARAGLLATIVAREANPATVVRYAYQRPVMRWADSAPVSGGIDTTQETTTSFKTPYSAADLVENGFKRRVGPSWKYAGPDADVLLDEAFANGYCFSIANRDRSRPSQIGLSFAAATKERGRVDIAGTLWIDTVARALRTIEYKYTGAEGLAQFLDTGGSTTFQEMPNGIVVVSRWGVRLLTDKVEYIPDNASGDLRPVRGVEENEAGGYLARATWPDGTTWVAPMGSARLALWVNDTTPVIANDVRLLNTDYRGVTDSAGRVEFRDLFPARYNVVVGDTLLEELGFDLNPQFTFVSVPGTVVEARVRAQSTAEQLMLKCAKRPSRTDFVAVVNVKDAAVGAPGVKVDVTYADKVISEKTGSKGSLVLCFDRNALNAPISVVGSRGDMQTQRIDHVINRRVMLFRLQLAPKPPSARDTVSRNPH
jgi:hypothetical protein